MSNFAWWYYSLSFSCPYHFQWHWPWVCQKHKVQIVLLASCLLLSKHMVATYIKKIKYSMLYMTSVYLRDIFFFSFQFCTWMWVTLAFALLVGLFFSLGFFFFFFSSHLSVVHYCMKVRKVLQAAKSFLSVQEKVPVTVVTKKAKEKKVKKIPRGPRMSRTEL